jgi:hypothetical protein
MGRIRGADCTLAEKVDKLRGFVLRHASANLGVGERPVEFSKQLFGDNDFELAPQPPTEQLRGSPGGGEQRGDKDVRVEDGAHSAAPTSLVLGFDGEFECGFLVEITALPEAVEQVKPEFSSQRLLDYLAVALPAAGTTHLDRSQNLVVNRQRGSYLRHLGIIAS